MALSNASPGRREDAGGPRSGNWIRFDPATFTSLKPELMHGVSKPATTADLEPHATEGGLDSGANRGMPVPAEAPAVGEGPVELNHNGLTCPGEVPTARRRLFAELGVTEDELLKLVNNAEFLPGVKRLKAAADAGPSASVTNTPMVVEVPSAEVAPIPGRAPVAAEVEGGSLDSDGGSVPSDAPVAQVAGVEGDLSDYE